MPEGKGPRIVQVLNDLSRVGLGFVYSDSTSQGPELLIPRKDSQTNKASFEFRPGRYGENFVEIGEDTSKLGAAETAHFNRKPEEVQDADTGEIFTNNPVFNTETSQDRETRKQEKRDRKG